METAVTEQAQQLQATKGVSSLKKCPDSAPTSIATTVARDVYRMVETRCKFCGCDLRLKVHESYDVSDPKRLIPLAACNPCADLRERRRNLHLRFSSVCSGIITLHESSHRSMTEKEKKDLEQLMDEARKSIESLVKAYLRLIGDWYHRNDMVFEDAMVDLFMQAPAQLSSHIGRLWKSVPLQQNLLP